jgi:hypothetical protein
MLNDDTMFENVNVLGYVPQNGQEYSIDLTEDSLERNRAQSKKKMEL